MPELPEVEITRRSFGARIAGSRVLAVRLGKPLRWPLGCSSESLLDQTVGMATRRGKYLWLPLERGGLLMHLGMSGSLAFLDGAPDPDAGVRTPGAHEHFELVTSQGTLRLTDPRRFGAVVWSPALDAGPAARLLTRLGIEPFDDAFTGDYLHGALQGRRVAVKQALLGGGIVVGAGNIYACEALHTAAIDPRTRSDRIGPLRARRLALALRETLTQALKAGGTTLRDFRDADGTAGHFQRQARVYGREGEACGRCGGVVRRIVQAQRSTFFCPTCQRR